MQRDDGYQDDADRANEEIKADRDAVAEGNKRGPTTMDDPAAIEQSREPEPMSDAVVMAAGRNHAEGKLQQGLPMDPDPRAVESGMRASSIAAIAYDAVQRYKEQLGQTYKWWVNLEGSVQGEIRDQVVAVIRGESMGAVGNHERWRKNMIAAGVTVEDDPRVGQGWTELDPVERRKALIFIKMVVALLQPV